MNTSIPRLELVSHFLCPYVQRALITLLEKDIEHDRTYIDLANKPDWFIQISPLGKVPLLKAGNEVLFESAVICEYLDEATPGSLHPIDPLTKAKHRAWIEFGSSILNSIGGFYSAADSVIFEQKRQEIINKFLWIERSLTAEPYFAGEHFSLVDATYAPIFRYFDVFDAIEGFGFFTTAPKVVSWRQALRDRSSVQNAVTAHYPQQLLTFLQHRHSYLSTLLS